MPSDKRTDPHLTAADRRGGPPPAAPPQFGPPSDRREVAEVVISQVIAKVTPAPRSPSKTPAETPIAIAETGVGPDPKRPESDRREFFVRIATLELGPEAEARLEAQRESLTAEQWAKRDEIGRQLRNDFVAQLQAFHMCPAGQAALGPKARDHAAIEKIWRDVDLFEMSVRMWQMERARIGAERGTNPNEVALTGEQFGELFRAKNPKLFRRMTEGYSVDFNPNTSLEARKPVRVEVPQASVELSPDALPPVKPAPPPEEGERIRVLAPEERVHRNARTRQIQLDRTPRPEDLETETPKPHTGDATPAQKRAEEKRASFWVASTVALVIICIGLFAGYYFVVQPAVSGSGPGATAARGGPGGDAVRAHALHAAERFSLPAPALSETAAPAPSDTAPPTPSAVDTAKARPSARPVASTPVAPSTGAAPATAAPNPSAITPFFKLDEKKP